MELPHLGMGLAYNAAGDVVATLDYLVRPEGIVDLVGLDEEGRLGEVFSVQGATGAGTFPAYLGAQAHDYRVIQAAGKITALQHKTNGSRIERADIEARIIAKLEAEQGNPQINLTEVIGAPDRPLSLTTEGKLRQRAVPVAAELPTL